jgi:catechol 2,3-dioxygenase-like lactoylglutathione lyase family enzyme
MFHHARLPVSDVQVSSDWYTEHLGFNCRLVLEEEDRVVGVALDLPCGVVIGLHQDSRRAAALCGFVVVALSVPNLSEWVAHLDGQGVGHGGLIDTHLGRCVRVADPDGILVELHPPEQPSADET